MNLSDQDFLEIQILNLENSYIGEMTYIKNEDNKFLYVSDEFAEEFNIIKDKDSKGLVHVEGIPNVPKQVALSILEQEKALYTTNRPLDSIYVHKHEGRTISYLVRKRLIRNPYTKNVIGILGNMEQFTPGYFRKVYLQLVKQTFNIPVKPQFKLTKFQNEIIFCLLMGFSTRKEIACVIGFFSNEFDEHKVKNTLYGLYEIFECNSTSMLLNNVLLNDVDISIPEGIITPCSFVIQK